MNTGLLMRATQGDLVKEGYLWKKGKVNTKSRRRWFVLRSSGQLFYCKDRETEPCGVIDLSDSFIFIKEQTPNAAAVKKDKNKFASLRGLGRSASREMSAIACKVTDSEAVHEALATMDVEYKSFGFDIVQRGSGRDFHITAESQAEMDEWTQCITGGIPAQVSHQHLPRLPTRFRYES
jgi:hypothetical protein